MEQKEEKTLEKLFDEYISALHNYNVACERCKFAGIVETFCIGETGTQLSLLNEIKNIKKTRYIDRKDEIKADIETFRTDLLEKYEIDEKNNPLKEEINIDISKIQLHDVYEFMNYKNALMNIIDKLTQYIKMIKIVQEADRHLNSTMSTVRESDRELRQRTVELSLLNQEKENIQIYIKILEIYENKLKYLNDEIDSEKEIVFVEDINNDLYEYIYNFSDTKCIRNEDYQEFNIDIKYMNTIINNRIKNDTEDIFTEKQQFSIIKIKNKIRPNKLTEFPTPGFENHIYYKTLKCDISRKCKQIKVTESGGFEKYINTIQFEVDIGIDTVKGKFVIFRWGDWREFDPFSYIIVLNNTRADYKKIEKGFNLHDNNRYENGAINYHTILRKIYSKKPSIHDITLYYDIKTRTFFNANDCTPLIVYYNTIKPKDEYFDTLKSICKSKSFNSNINVNLLQTILENKDNFLFPFVKEFGGAMDVLKSYASGFFKKNIRNLAEELIWDVGDDEKVKSRKCEKKEIPSALCNLPR
jgi:hypothetical protein